MGKFKIFEKLLRPSGGVSKASSKDLTVLNTNVDTENRRTSSSSSRDSSSDLCKILTEEFSCNCCLEMLKRPVTLTCGHSFCQLCLANWYLASSNTTCPSCRQEWRSLPRVNHKLTSSIQKLAQYEQSISTQSHRANSAALNEYMASASKSLSREEKKTLKRFEDKYKTRSERNHTSSFYLFRGLGDFNLNREMPTNDDMTTTTTTSFEELSSSDENEESSVAYVERPTAMQPAQQTANNHRLPPFHGVEHLLNSLADSLSQFARPVALYGFSFGLFIIFTLLGSIWLLTALSYKINKTSNNIGQLRVKYRKAPETWSAAECQEFLYALGPWTNKIANVAQQTQLDGKRLLKLSEHDLSQSPFRIGDHSIRRLLVDSVRVLTNYSVYSVDFWEFKNSNRQQLVFFGLFFESFPRATLLYYYYYYHMGNAIGLISKISEQSLLDSAANHDFIHMENLRRVLLSRSEEMKNHAVLESSSSRLFYLLRFPYLRLKNVFQALFLETNRPTCVFVSFNCVVLTLSELCVLADLARSLAASDHRRFIFLSSELALKTASKLVLYSVFYTVYGVLPDFMIDLVFFYFLYFKLVFNVYELYSYFKSLARSVLHYFL